MFSAVLLETKPESATDTIEVFLAGVVVLSLRRNHFSRRSGMDLVSIRFSTPVTEPVACPGDSVNIERYLLTPRGSVGLVGGTSVTNMLPHSVAESAAIS